MRKVDNLFKTSNTNWIKVITGPMFAGKTTELLRTLKLYNIAGIHSVAFKHCLDTRWEQKVIHSRDGYQVNAITVNNALEILHIVQDLKKQEPELYVIAIDEVQFFDSNIIAVVQQLADQNLIVICTGLDLDRNGQPFGSMPALLAIADDVIKLKAICPVCGSPATKTYLKPQYRSHQEQNIVLIGDNEMFESRCNQHFKDE